MTHREGNVVELFIQRIFYRIFPHSRTFLTHTHAEIVVSGKICWKFHHHRNQRTAFFGKKMMMMKLLAGNILLPTPGNKFFARENYDSESI